MSPVQAPVYALLPGDRFVKPAELARRAQLDRKAVREGLRNLWCRGLVDRRMGPGKTKPTWWYRKKAV